MEAETMDEGMDIVFFGSSLVSSWWNGAATYYRGLIRALASRGHRIRFYEPDAYGRQEHRDIADPDWAEVVVYPAADERRVFDVVSSVERADVFVKTSGVGVHDGLLEHLVLEAAQQCGALAVFCDVDAPATLTRMESDPLDPLRSLIPRYDLIVTYGGGPPVQQRYAALGAHRCELIYNALDPQTHFPVPSVSRFRADVSLLANRLPDREDRIDEFFFRAASLSPTRTFLLGGNGWDGKAMPPNVRSIGHVGTVDHNAFNCSATAVLNVTRDSMAANGWSPATRVFEATGVGACLVTDAWTGVGDFLEPGAEVLVANDGSEVAAHLGALDATTARGIGTAARARVLGRHTYAQRAVQFDRAIREAAGARTLRAEVSR
jgi:spore maturation protein CgeB